MQGSTLDISPFYRSYGSKYDVFVSHKIVKIYRVYKGLLNLAAFIMMLTDSLNYPSWFTGTSGVIISFCVAADAYYAVILALEAFKYPRKLTIFIKDIEENRSLFIKDIEENRSLLLEDSAKAIGNNS